MDAQWQWQSNKKLWNVIDLEKISWTSYSSEENSLIEQAYRSSSPQLIRIQNNKYVIDVKNLIQYVDISPTKQRRIRRLSHCQDMNNEHIRGNRFIFPEDQEDFFQLFEREIKFGSLMIQEWRKHYMDCNRNNAGMSEKDIVDAAIKGIEEEGSKNVEYQQETAIICDELRKVQNCENKLDIKRCAVRLYTRDGFLYRLVNRALRELDRRLYRETLGPYCYLLYTFLCLRPPDVDLYRGTVYRGANLHSGMIGRFRKEMKKGDQFLTWLGFTSTTKNRAVANVFNGNTLFEILLSDTDYFTSQGIDISPFSKIPDEEEVLLSPGFQFEIVDVQTLEPTEEKPIPHYHIQLLPRQLPNVPL